MNDVTVYFLSERPRLNLCDAIPFRVFPRFETVLVHLGPWQNVREVDGAAFSVGGNSEVLVISTVGTYRLRL